MRRIADTAFVDDARAARLSPASTVRCSLALAAIAYFFTAVDRYGMVVWGLPPPVYAAIAVTAAAAVLVVVQPTRSIGLLRSPVGLWALAYFAITTIWAAAAGGNPDALPELQNRYRSIALLLAFMVVLDDPRARRVAGVALTAAIIVAAVVNVAELASVVTFPDVEGVPRTGDRPAGLYVNPNIAALAIALGIPAVAERVPRFWRTPLVVVGTVGVVATFSRGGMLCLGVALLWVGARGALGSWRLLVTSAVLLTVLVGSYHLVQASHLLDENTQAHLTFAPDESGRIRVLAAEYGWELFKRAPWLGNGLGTTGVFSYLDEKPHNMFVNFAADQGIIGLLIFPALGFSIAYRAPRAAAFAAALMLAGFFSHNLLEDPASLLLIAYVATSEIPDPARAAPPPTPA